MKLKIKDCYVGATITIKTPIGRIKFDTITAEEKDYEYYSDSGFSHMFEEVKPKTIKYKGIDEMPMKITNKDGKID